MTRESNLVVDVVEDKYVVITLPKISFCREHIVFVRLKHLEWDETILLGSGESTYDIPAAAHGFRGSKNTQCG